MPRNLWKRVAALLAGTLAMAMAAPSAVHAQTNPDKVFYIVCYVFTPDGDGTAIATTPYRTTWGGWFNGSWERKLNDRILPGTGYRTGRCNAVESAEAAEAYYRKSGYNFLKRVDWPKDLFPAAKPPAPAGPRPPVWVSCGYDAQDGTHALTPTFLMDDPGGNWTGWDWVKRMDAQTDPQRSSMFSCSPRKTREEAEAERQHTIDFYRGRRNIVTLSPPPGARFSGGATASAPSPSPPRSSAGSLTVKTDTSLRDAGKAWDEQVKKTLAAEAQKKVETAAKQVQADAKLKADYEAFFAERRKQGRAQ